MKILSWNIRGLGKREKKGKPRKLDVLFFQETKLKSTNKFLIDSIWGHCNYDFMKIEADENAAVGLLCI